MTTRSEYEKAIREAFKKGPTHARPIDSVNDCKRDALSLNLVMFGKYVMVTAVESDDEGLLTNYEEQRMMAKIYTDMILGMLRDFIDCIERGDLDEPE